MISLYDSSSWIMAIDGEWLHKKADASLWDMYLARRISSPRPSSLERAASRSVSNLHFFKEERLLDGSAIAKGTIAANVENVCLFSSIPMMRRLSHRRG